MEKKKLIAGGILLAVAVAGASFYGGMRYGSYKNFSKAGVPIGNRVGQGMGDDARFKGKMPGGDSQRQMGSRPGAEMGGGLAGQITSIDDKSFTVKAPDGSSKIVFFSERTAVVKADPAQISDLTVGKEVMVGGKTSPDGSMTAGTVQIK